MLFIKKLLIFLFCIKISTWVSSKEINEFFSNSSCGSKSLNAILFSFAFIYAENGGHATQMCLGLVPHQFKSRQRLSGLDLDVGNIG